MNRRTFLKGLAIILPSMVVLPVGRMNALPKPNAAPDWAAVAGAASVTPVGLGWRVAAIRKGHQ